MIVLLLFLQKQNLKKAFYVHRPSILWSMAQWFEWCRANPIIEKRPCPPDKTLPAPINSLLGLSSSLASFLPPSLPYFLSHSLANTLSRAGKSGYTILLLHVHDYAADSRFRSSRKARK